MNEKHELDITMIIFDPLVRHVLTTAAKAHVYLFIDCAVRTDSTVISSQLATLLTVHI